MLNVTSNIDAVQKTMQRVSKKMRYAESEAINQSAKIAARAQRAEAEQKLDRPTPYVLNGIYNPKTKLGFVGVFSKFSTLEAQLIPGGPRGSFREGGARINRALVYQVDGGIRGPKATAIVVPVARSVINRYGNLPRGKIKSLLGRSDTVQIGAREGVPPGIYQRLKGGGLRFLVAYEPRVSYRKKLNYYTTGTRAFSVQLKPQFLKAFEAEMRGKG